MPGSLENADRSFSEFEDEVVVNRNVRQGRPSLRSHVDFRTGAGGQFAMARDKIGVQMALKDVLDRNAVVGSRLQVQLDVPLRIYYDGFALRG
jgi:hypothetical protein